MRHLTILLALIATPALSAETDTGTKAAALLAGTAGRWQGELQYRDYQSNTWQGLPMTVTIAAQPDRVTTVRTAQFDDGPKTGIVTITTVNAVDPVAATLSYAAFRRSRPTDTGVEQISAAEAGADATHWKIVTMERRTDGNQVADVRETTTRDGDTLTTLKEVNPVEDGKDEWLPRNRSVLRRVGG
ncbi:hypothetical protein AB5I39_15700 [Sphingomonas sp. MMS24-J45]|uniref:hypothetical protein n=1 Tax=Sphingomonas sp. MMS24-J45 TaxID=3238806 RepID=UPI00384B418B